MKRNIKVLFITAVYLFTVLCIVRIYTREERCSYEKNISLRSEPLSLSHLQTSDTAIEACRIADADIFSLAVISGGLPENYAGKLTILLASEERQYEIRTYQSTDNRCAAPLRFWTKFPTNHIAEGEYRVYLCISGKNSCCIHTGKELTIRHSHEN